MDEVDGSSEPSVRRQRDGNPEKGQRTREARGTHAATGMQGVLGGTVGPTGPREDSDQNPRIWRGSRGNKGCRARDGRRRGCGTTPGGVTPTRRVGHWEEREKGWENTRDHSG